MKQYRRSVRWLGGTAGIAVLSLAIHACQEPLAVVNLVPTSLSAVGATTLSDTVGKAVKTPLSVKVLDQESQPVVGATVNVTVVSGNGHIGSGTATSTSISTDASGAATVTTFVLGNAVGENRLRFAATGGTATAIDFVINGTNDKPAALTAAAANTQGQSAVAGSAVTNAPSVKLADQYGNPVAGVAVTFAVTAGSGSLSATTGTTNANGIATAGTWTLGTTVGNNAVTATVPGTGITGNPLVFSATGTVGPAAKIIVKPGTPTSQGQTANAGSLVAVAPVVQVQDANNNNTGAGSTVVFAIASGGGKLLASSTDPGQNSISVTTDANGQATVFGWRLGSVGANSVTATLNPTGTTPPVVTFTATGVAGTPASLAIVTETPSSNNQSRPLNLFLPVAPGVVVRDANGNANAGVTVRFLVLTGGGKLFASATDTPRDTVVMTTDANGVARVFGYKLGQLGTNTMKAELVSNTSLSQTFAETGIVGPAALIAVASSSIPTTQSTIANTPVPTAPSVIVTDSGGTAVASATVDFVIQTGGGNVSLTSSAGTGDSVTVTAGTTTPNVGVATLGSWRPGTVGTNANTMRAKLRGTTQSVLFTATGTVGAPAQLAPTNAPYGFARIGQAVGGSPKVTVRDAGGNVVPGVTVTWTVFSGTSTLSASPATSTTDANGLATMPGTWNIGAGAAAGSTTVLRATVNSLTQDFSTTVVGAPTTMAINAGNNQTASISTAVPVTPAVLVTDAGARPVPGITVTYLVTAGAGVLTGPTATTDSLGIARVGSWTLGSSIGTNTMTASSTGLTTQTFNATATAGPPAAIVVTQGSGQTATVATTLTTAIKVKVTDASNNPIQNATVTFAASNGGSATAAAATAADGTTTTSWTLGQTAGTQTLTATVSGTNPVVSVNVTATGTAETSTATAVITKNTGDAQAGSPSTAVTTAPSVLVADRFGNPMSGVGVTFSVSSGGGSITGGTQTTNALGIATVGSWTLGASGSQSLLAQLTANAAKNVTFTASIVIPCNSNVVHTIGSTSSGGLAASSCQRTASSVTSGADQYKITVASQQVFQATVTSSFAPRLFSRMYADSSQFWISSGSSPLTRAYVVAAGTYFVDVASSTAGGTGSYTLQTTGSAPATTCSYIATKGITINAQLTGTTCGTYASAAPPDSGESTNPRAYTSYYVYLPAGQAMTVNMSAASGFDSFLEAYVGNTWIASNDDAVTAFGGNTLNASMTVPSSGTGRYIEIRATHFSSTTSTTSPQTFAYTLQIQ